MANFKVKLAWQAINIKNYHRKLILQISIKNIENLTWKINMEKFTKITWKIKIAKYHRK